MRGLPVLTAMLLIAPGAAMAAPLTWECDTPGGHYSELSQVQPGPAYAMRGTIKWAQSYTDRSYSGFAQIRVANAAQTRWIGVAMQSAPRSARIQFGVRWKQDGGEVQFASVGTAAPGEVVPFEISISAAQEVTISVGGQQRTARMEIGPGATVGASCSTGEFQFGAMDLGG